MFKQIAVVSGKGGTGKTTFSSSLIDIFDNVLVIPTFTFPPYGVMPMSVQSQINLCPF